LQTHQPEKILSFSPYSYWKLHALYEVAICHNLQARGHSYRYVSCDGLFSDCDMFWASTVGPRPANACEVCQSQVKSLLKDCRIPNTWLGTYKSAVVVTEARAFVDQLADADLLRAEFQQYPIGAWVKSSVHTHLRINVIDLTDAKHCAAMRSYLCSGVVALRCIGQMLEVERPDVMLMFNGRMAVTRIALELAKERGIRVVCHERGLAKETLLLWENEGCLALRPYAKLWQEWGSVPLAASEVSRVTQWLIDRAHGTNLNWKTFSVQSSLGPVATFLENHKGRQVWSLFTSSMDEIASDDDYTSVFGTQNRWIEETLRFVGAQPGIALVIRVHPNSGGKNSTGKNQDELRYFDHLRTAVPNNVVVVMPDDPVSSYALVDRTQVGLVYGSTIALEMACRGIPVFLAARSPWMPCSGLQFLTSAESYASLLTDRAARARTPVESGQIARAAYRFAYAYIQRWNISFPLVRMPDVHNGELTAKTLEELKPGVHACLDYCVEVVLGVRSSIPPAIAPVPKGAEQAETVALQLALRTFAGAAPEPAPALPVRASVVITCYNYGKFLRDCVRSVARQTFQEFELIIVNDGSTDDSLAVAQACVQEFSALRISIVDQPNSGQPALARNAGIRQAKGTFILPIDADDQIAPGYLAEAFKVFDANPAVDLVYSDSIFDDGKSRTRKIPGRFEAKALGVANQLVYCCVYRRAVWEQIGGYRNNVRGYEDWDFWLAASLSGARAAYVPCVGLLYNDKASGVYSQTVAHHQARTAQVMLNNRSGYSAPQLQRAQAVLDAAAVSMAAPAAATVPSAPTLVSVVIPCYNQAQYLAEAVESVIAQTYPQWEILIVNDGSPDATSEGARVLIAQNPTRRIRLIEKANGGLADARNAGIREAKGTYILPLDADDRIHPEMLAKTVNLLNQHPEIAIAYTDYVYFGHLNQRLFTREYNFKTLCTAYNQFTCCSLYRKAAWEAVGGYNTNMVFGYEDWDFWVGCGERGFVGKRIPEVLFYYRTKEKSMVSDARNNHQALFSRIVLNHPRLYAPEMVAQATQILTAAGTLGAGEGHPDGNRKAVSSGDKGALVSICIPTCNGEEFLAATIASAVAQSYPAIEIIISDDASTDRTLEIAGAGVKNSAFPVQILRHERLGLVGNWGHCIRKARGKYIKFLFQDDLLEPDCVASLVEVAERDPAIGLVFSPRRIERRHDGTKNDALEAAYRDGVDVHKAWTRLQPIQSGLTLLQDPQLLANPINKVGEPTTVLLTRSAVEAVGGFDGNLQQLVDVEMWLRIMTQYKVGYVDRVLSCFRLHGKQTTQSNLRAGLIAEDWKRFFGKLATDPVFGTLPPSHRSHASQMFVRLGGTLPAGTSPNTFQPAAGSDPFQQTIERAQSLVREGRLEEAIAQMEQTLRVSPTIEGSARSNEILDLLRAARPSPAALPTSIAPAATASEEIFGPDEVGNIEQLVATYRDNPADPARDQLRELQQGLMNFLVTAPADQLGAHFSGGFGRVFRALVTTGLSTEVPTDETMAQLAVLDEALAGPSDSKKGFDYRPLLARLLCAPAHRGVVTIAPDRIPAWFLDDYLGYVLQAPPVFVMVGEAEQYRAHLLAWSRAIRQLTRTRPSDPLTNKVAQFFAMRASYIPLYFSNSNTRELAENRAAIMEFVLARNGAAIEAKFPKRAKPRGRIKVGYVSAHFGAQTETHVTLPSLQLDRSKFEICLFPVATNPGPVEDYCRSFADSFTPLPKELPRQVKTIRDAALDVVIIGTNVTAVTNQVSLIALHRLAPLQLASYCSPVSTGMRHIDGYLSGTLNDHPGLQEHFSEKLYFCEGPPGCLDYTVESPGSGKTFDRAGLGLADDDVVFVNAAACFKILPEMQETWAKILAAVPKSRLLLLPFNPHWSKAFPVKQFERTLTEACARRGVGRERFILAGSLPSRAEVKALERVADVYLDTSPFSGSISVIDPLELGLPLVVQEGATHRSRMASALLREIGLPELITTDEAAYIALAHRLGTETTYRRQLNERILAGMARRPKFINTLAYARGLGALLESLVRVK
jgi:glycosyltransferase involved in cell wall biosynthesis/predicted O-linked N-acetylglucosamine transferase (SPINDLY family)